MKLTINNFSTARGIEVVKCAEKLKRQFSRHITLCTGTEQGLEELVLESREKDSIHTDDELRMGIILANSLATNVLFKDNYCEKKVSRDKDSDQIVIEFLGAKMPICNNTGAPLEKTYVERVLKELEYIC